MWVVFFSKINKMLYEREQRNANFLENNESLKRKRSTARMSSLFFDLKSWFIICHKHFSKYVLYFEKMLLANKVNASLKSCLNLSETDRIAK